MRSPALAALVAATVLVAAGTTPAASETTIDGPARVLVVGDSVVLGAKGSVESLLSTHEVAVDAEVSRTTGRSADAALTHGTDWDVVVVMLGHNDGGSPAVYQPPYRRLLDAYAAVPRIVVVTLHEVRPSYAGVNAFLRDEAERRSNVVVLDWNAIASAEPGLTAGDGLHLTSAGARRMADEIGAQVFRAEVELTPPTTTTTAPTTTAPTTTTSTTTTRPESTATPATVAAAAPQADDDDSAAPWAIGGLTVASAAAATVLIRRRRRSG